MNNAMTIRSFASIAALGLSAVISMTSASQAHGWYYLDAASNACVSTRALKSALQSPAAFRRAMHLDGHIAQTAYQPDSDGSLLMVTVSHDGVKEHWFRSATDCEFERDFDVGPGTTLSDVSDITPAQTASVTK